jgi:MYND finger
MIKSITFLQTVYYCDTSCQRAAWPAHSAECRYLVKVRPRQPPNLVRLLLRLLARHRHTPDQADRLPGGALRSFNQLKTHREEVAGSEERAAAFQSFLRVLQDCVGSELYEPAEVFDAYCKVLINAVEITDPSGDAIGTGTGIKYDSYFFITGIYIVKRIS